MVPFQEVAGVPLNSSDEPASLGSVVEIQILAG